MCYRRCNYIVKSLWYHEVTQVHSGLAKMARSSKRSFVVSVESEELIYYNKFKNKKSYKLISLGTACPGCVHSRMDIGPSILLHFVEKI